MKEQKFMVWLVPDEQLPYIGAVLPVLPKSEPHITLEYGVTRTEAKNKEGSKFPFSLGFVVHDGNIQAATVNFSNPVPYCKNKHPHFTISMRAGVKPNQSNDMLENISAIGQAGRMFFLKPESFVGTVKFVPMG